MPRILIVDDEKDNREALKLALQDENPSWEFFTAKGDVEGKALLKRQIQKHEPIDLVLTDLVMTTDQSGMTMLQEARKIDPYIMAIMFTAKEKSLDRYAAFDYGAFDVIEKNIRGKSAAQEINIKARAALRYRDYNRRVDFLRKYFDPRIFETIEKDPSRLVLQQRTITICFWDIRGFSRLCEVLKASPTLISDFLKEYSEIAAQSVFDHGGVLDKFIGDGVMALFGFLDNEDDEGRSASIAAVEAALDFDSRFEKIHPKWMEQWSLYAAQMIEIGLGCGINTGEALVGNVGTDLRDQFTALGPQVNLASRIEARSKAGQILISQSTQVRVKNKFKIADAGQIDDIKNIPGQFRLFSVEKSPNAKEGNN